MSRKPWKRICINLSIEQDADLRRLSAYKGQRIASVVQKLIESYIKENKKLLESLKEMNERYKIP